MTFSLGVPKMFPGDKNQKLSFPAYNSNKKKFNELSSKFDNNVCYDKDFITKDLGFDTPKRVFHRGGAFHLLPWEP